MDTTNTMLKPGYILRSPNYSYRIEHVLGIGGFGITYLASSVIKIGNVSIKANFAIKEYFLSNDCERASDSTNVVYSNPAKERVENSRKDFISEAKRLHNIGSVNDNIVKVNEVFEANNTAYYVMEYIEGQTLREYVEKKGPLNEIEMLSIINPIIEAVKYLHNNRITHLDIKPDNIMLITNDEDEIRPILIDFGLSQHYDKKGKPTSTINSLGYSENYAPIEQYAGIVTFSPSADIYAIGATMWFCLVGKDPQKSIDLSDDNLSNSLPEYVSQKIRYVIAKATASNRKNREIEVINSDKSKRYSELPDQSLSKIGYGQTKVIDTKSTKRINVLSELSSSVGMWIRNNKLIMGCIVFLVIIASLCSHLITSGSKVSTIQEEMEAPTAIDLGLSVMWGDRNLGAHNIIDSGNYYEISEDQLSFFSDSIISIIGPDWRLPNKDELIELALSSDEEIKSSNGKKFADIRVNRTGEHLIIPLAGWKDNLFNEYAFIGSSSFEGSDMNILTIPRPEIGLFNPKYYKMSLRLVKICPDKTFSTGHTTPNNYDLVASENGKIIYLSPTEWINRNKYNGNNHLHKIGVVFNDKNNKKLILSLNIDSVRPPYITNAHIPNLSQAEAMGDHFRKLNMAMVLYGGSTLENHRYLIEERNKYGEPLEYSPRSKSLTGCGYYSVKREILEIP